MEYIINPFTRKLDAFSASPPTSPVFGYAALATYQIVNTQITVGGIPTQAQGTQILSVTITPQRATSLLEINFSVVGTYNGVGADAIAALFRDATANALVASVVYTVKDLLNVGLMNHVVSAGSTNPTTFKIRVGASVGNFYINGDAFGGSFNNIGPTILTVTEHFI